MTTKADARKRDYILSNHKTIPTISPKRALKKKHSHIDKVNYLSNVQAKASSINIYT